MYIQSFIIILYLLGGVFHLSAQDSVYIKVHFLYGSKPAKAYKGEERKWFGGRPGGHVGVETNPDQVLHFMPKGTFHYVGRQKNRHSQYRYEPAVNFWQIFDARIDSLKRLTIVVPVSAMQKRALDSIRVAFLEETPYDYAFLGMRCAAATYDIMSHAGFFTHRHHRFLRFYIFRPKTIRKKMLRLARQYDWEIQRKEGTKRRVWERD
jgi:hypothetical protein